MSQNNRTTYSFKKIKSGLMIFLCFTVLFTSKWYGYIDVPFLALLSFTFLAGVFGRLYFPKKLLPFVWYLAIITVYSGFISALYSFAEIVFFVKFLHALIFFIFLYFFVCGLKIKWTYDKFIRLYIYMVVLHSIIMFSMLVSSEIRHFVYSFTGFSPRGPEWSRSPGLTRSYNATAILHVAALWFLVSQNSFSILGRLMYAAIIIGSCVFLGRYIFIIGIMVILLFSIYKNPVRSSLLGIALVALLAVASNLIENVELNDQGLENQLLSNVYAFTLPFLSDQSSSDNILNYSSDVMGKHVYFSDKWHVVLFGNSYAGHVGFAGPHAGQTGSDVGFINSVNANGLLVTLSIYAFHAFLIWYSRSGDWPSVAVISFLCLALSFKETGLFESHSLPLLLIVFFYQISSVKYKTSLPKTLTL